MLTKEDFYEYLFSLIPLKRIAGESVKGLLERVYSDYLLNLCQIGEMERGKIPDWEGFCLEQKSICDVLVLAVSLMSQGMHSRAYSILSPILSRLSKWSAIYNQIPCTQLFRMRKYPESERKNATAEDMFHIPFNKRDIIKTQRFSSPGYPCIYLGNSIYGCWEEMGRPLFDLCMTSRFDLKKERLNLYCLLFPDKRFFEIDDALLRIPLILACMIDVQNKDAVFKPEYIIPQLVTEWIITTRNFKDDKNDPSTEYDGIMYSSIHLGGDAFNYPSEEFYNICIPAFDAGDSLFCKTLSKMFQVTEPTCYEYEVLNRNVSIRSEALNGIREYERVKDGILRDSRITEDKKKDIVKDIDKSINYCKSRFKLVEDALSDRTLFPARDINTD